MMPEKETVDEFLGPDNDNAMFAEIDTLIQTLKYSGDEPPAN